MLKLYNTLTRKIEDFIALNPPKVGIYACGPTVYDFAHIGNLRSFLMYDVLRRVLKAEGYEVTFVENITDIDDKIIKKAKEKNLEISEFTTQFTDFFLKDLNKLNITLPDIQPKATEHITQMVKYIESLVKKKLAYVEKDGSVYFDISKFPDYGKLSGVKKRELKSGTRILSDEYSKDSVQDFALWKSVEADQVGWNSPWGKGRPGWHIECSVMSQEYLGDTLDIHAGGIDLMFPHHENEIAQAQGKTGQPFVKYFVHGEHLLVDGQKMSKSLNNFYTLRDVESKDMDPLSLRYLVLTAHYRDKLNFTWKSLEAAQNALNNLRETVRDWEEPKIGCAQYEEDFFKALNNDLNTPQALAVMWDLVKSDYPSSAKAESLLKMDQVLGLGLDKYLGKKIDIPDKVQILVDEREQARKDSNFEKSDQLRKSIKDMGFEIEDAPEGPKIK